ncbi:MAG: agmatinase [Chloroflexota bacterium]
MASDTGLPQSSPTFAGLPSSTTDISAARFVVLPVPYEATTEWLSGTRHAPAEIINCSRLLELYDHELDIDTSRAGIATVDELPPVLSGPEHMVAAVNEHVGSWLDRNKVPILLGGEHTITIGAAAAASERVSDLSVLQLDAHSDLRDSYMGTRWGQATVMRRIYEICPSIAAMGIRSLSVEERDFVRDNSLPIVFWPPEDPNWRASLVERLKHNVYVTIDADVFDPGVLPWVGTPEPGGPGWWDILALLRDVTHNRNVVGFDVVEFSPYGPGAAASAYTLAKLIYRLVGYLSITRTGGNHR